MKYKSKTTTIEAVRFKACERGADPDDFDTPFFNEDPDWVKEAFEKKNIIRNHNGERESDYVHLLVTTSNSERSTLNPDDYLIKLDNGYLCTCHPDLFEQVFEEVE